ncbi:hypothetical protein GCM10017673_02250 [Streptosporangium violaceochromogenes]|nr:hypothetical protein GCM10017673_02250 [Streptosporangium violaceochromogenes]
MKATTVERALKNATEYALDYLGPGRELSADHDLEWFSRRGGVFSVRCFPL